MRFTRISFPSLRTPRTQVARVTHTAMAKPLRQQRHTDDVVPPKPTLSNNTRVPAGPTHLPPRKSLAVDLLTNTRTLSYCVR